MTRSGAKALDLALLFFAVPFAVLFALCTPLIRRVVNGCCTME